MVRSILMLYNEWSFAYRVVIKNIYEIIAFSFPMPLLQWAHL